jgi:hypothetical protein
MPAVLSEGRSQQHTSDAPFRLLVLDHFRPWRCTGQPSKITKAHHDNASQLSVSLGSGLIGLTAEVKNQMACAFTGDIHGKPG